MELPFKLPPLSINMNLLNTSIIFRGCQSEVGRGNWAVLVYSHLNLWKARWNRLHLVPKTLNKTDGSSGCTGNCAQDFVCISRYRVGNRKTPSCELVLSTFEIAHWWGWHQSGWFNMETIWVYPFVFEDSSSTKGYPEMFFIQFTNLWVTS